MTSRETRQVFLDFFAERGHRRVPSSPLVLPNDPTLLFANAGMNQFKDVFTGRERRDYSRAVSVQKCLRVSGKHNDLEMVGRTPRHHTFFEMLGNFSFGDYFKEEAIRLAWELATEIYGLPADRLWVSVFGGSDRFEADDEAARIWTEAIGVPSRRVLRLGESENFWRMGDTGPCGPCSEIHVDLGEELTSVSGPSTPETDERRFLEIWNLVFMQFDQLADGGLDSLPRPSVDTGMGLERIVAVLQGHSSNFDTDVFRPLLDAAATRAGTHYGASDDNDFALRVIADHTRALCFLVADGVVPANDKRGYVLRRLLRRAIRFGRKLGIDEPFLHDVTPVVIDGLGDVYPELVAAREAILEVGRREETRFAETLSAGLALLEQALAKTGDRLDGATLFRLYDTYGFPLDLARDIAEERGVHLDEAGFDVEMQAQRARAQASWKGAARRKADGVWAGLAAGLGSEFRGYDTTRVDEARVVALLRDDARVETLEAGEKGEVVLDATPFYAESGGQVADTGYLSSDDGRARVVDAQRPADGLIVQRVEVESGRVRLEHPLLAEVDAQRRDAVCRNHTATHLLHAALREVVGTHVKQAGSLVAPERLRFDFSHFSGLSDAALGDVESLVNDKVLADLPVTTDEMDLDAALDAGAMALFGEKYGGRVRVVRIGDFSTELCGGTHSARSGEIGLIKLIAERGIASGTRRVEAVTGAGALARFRRLETLVSGLEKRLAVAPDELLGEIERRGAELRELQRELVDRRRGSVRESLFAREPADVHGVRVLAERVDGATSADLRELADGLRGKLGSGVVVLGRAEEEKASLLVAVTEDLVKRIHAGKLVRTLAAIIGGGGGGRADMAEAGGKSPGRLDEALDRARVEIEMLMEAAES